MNLKKYYRALLAGNEKLAGIVGVDNILAAYPQKVKTFPLVVYEDNNSSDVAFSDNLPDGVNASVRIHIFSKTLKGYPKAEDIAELVRSIFRQDYWACTLSEDTADVDDNIRHRIMDFTRSFFGVNNNN